MSEYMKYRRESFQPEDSKDVWEVVTELGANVSDEEWSKVPQDLAIHLDHYLYGTSE